MSAARALLVIAAGGTGGHMFPAQALAEAMLGRAAGAFALVTDARGEQLRRARSPRRSIRLHPFGEPRPARLQRRLLRGRLAGHRPRRRLARRWRRIAPAAVVGFGGYPSLPAMIAARACAACRRCCTSRTACSAGSTGMRRRAASSAVAHLFAARAYLAEDDRRARLVGNPVRAAVLALARRDLSRAGRRSARSTCW